MTGENQTPIAVVGLSCRLPGNSNSPEQFWRFLLDGKIAGLAPPPTRFSLKGHYDGTMRPWTMRSPGGMFIDADLRDLDAGFFGLSQVDAISMDPQQRQLLEVVYEGLENAGLTMEKIKSKSIGCFVGSYASDYSDIQTRDPEDRTPSFTTSGLIQNRLLSMTIDTACSGSLISVDLACRYLDSGDADGAIVAGCNLYMSPEHNMDQSAMTAAASPTGRCWTFDARADGYIKAEAINCLVLKRLDDAVRDGDPIRAVIRGTSTNSDGWTPGIASPSAEAQGLAIRRAYERAGITSFNDTAYLECHGTGTPAGDPIECRAASSVFSKSRPEGSRLRIGSVKSNIGHSEPAAGISAMIKTVLVVERGIIPGNPTFDIPNPNIDFDAYKVLPSKAAIPWPQGDVRRASVNSFGYGGSNAHAILEHPASLVPGFEPTGVTSYAPETEDFDLLADDDREDTTRRLLVFSANDEVSLKAYVKECIRHLSNPTVKIQSADLEYTLAYRRTRHFFRAYVLSDGPKFKESQVVYGKLGETPRIGFVFTGQGAQWPQMGRELLEKFPVALHTVQRLDEALQSMPEPPSWSLASELRELRTVEHMRLPTFSQPLVTALQLGLVAVLRDWGVSPAMVVGHSSGEIAAAVTAGYLSPEDGIKVAYLRGKAAEEMQASQSQREHTKLGMLAIGLGPLECESYLKSYPLVQIACRNSPKSVTVSGPVLDLEHIRDSIKADGHFARLLLVDLAYHSQYMEEIAERYRTLLRTYCPGLITDQVSRPTGVSFFSTVSGALLTERIGIEYWVQNMVSPVLFDQGVAALIKNQNGSATHLIEVGPSGALAGPINQIKQALDQDTASIEYTAACARADDSTGPLYELAGKLFFSGVNVDFARVESARSDTGPQPRVIVDLPNYQWNHSVKYWHESLASRDWRYRHFPPHDLLGTKVLGTPWSSPTFKRTLRLKDVPWIRDHTLGTEVVFPASGYIAMAVEAMFQTGKASGIELLSEIHDISQATYRLRDVYLLRALVLEEDSDSHIYLSLNPAQGQADTWFRFKIMTLRDDIWTEHCSGFVRISPAASVSTSEAARRQPETFRYPTPARLWYKSMYNVGFDFGPRFQNMTEVESTAGKRANRARVQFPDHPGQDKESKYTIHPSVFDSFFQTGIPALYNGHRTLIDQALVPRLIDEIVISPGAEKPKSGLAECSAVFVTGRRDKTQNYKSNVVIYNEDSGQVLTEISGLHYTELDIPTSKAREASQKEIFMSIDWKADISLLGNHVSLDSLAALDSQNELLSRGLLLPPAAALLVSLLKHKVARPSVVDLDMLPVADEQPTTESEAQEVYLPALESHLSSLRRYCYTSSAPEHLLKAQKNLKSLPGAEFHIHNITESSFEKLPFDTAEKFDLVLLRIPSADINENSVRSAVTVAHRLCTNSGFLVLVQQRSLLDDTESASDRYADSEPGVAISWTFTDIETVLHSSGFAVLAKSSSSEAVAAGSGISSDVYLCSPQVGKVEEQKDQKDQDTLRFPIVDFSRGASDESLTLIQSFRDLGWTGDLTEVSAASSLPLNDAILLIDSPQAPLLASIADSDWDSLGSLMKAGRRILWLTLGSQMNISSPSHALVHGFARSLRSEEPTLGLKVLDLSSFSSAAAARSTLSVMKTLLSTASHDQQDIYSQNVSDNEYCERDGTLYISRIVPDKKLIKAALANKTGGELQETWLRNHPKTVKLHCERLGVIGSLHFNEIADGPEQDTLGSGEVEVGIQAAGLNFKDIMATLGVVPEDEHLLGLEGAGIITRVGSNVTYRVGDRVVVHSRGSFANRIRVPKENVFLLPKSVSFEEGATMSIVFFTAVYSLMEIAQLKRGQTILIHSAAGGVGLASIQICRHLGAEVFATVGNPDKKRFLVEECGIPSERIFSSRNIDFAAGIRDLTGGRGVDFVLNFLTGELLDESWRLLADNGTLLEIGKKDIVDRNTLSMEPFDRNCSYRGIDISKPSITNDLPLIEKILQTVRSLLTAGHIRPISPRKVFPFDKILDAMRYMRSGEHIGKIVISDGDAEDVKVPIRRAPPSLLFDPRATYLIVGGLKGLCGSLAVYLARSGVKSLTVMCRGGADDQRSRHVIEDVNSLGAEVKIVRGDVSHLEDVQQLFKNSQLPIKGVIQGAMVLRDKTLETMTLQEYHESLACKFAGTWNLHHAAAEQERGRLDFFTMLSSISGVVGTAGQANYAAGNAFQDAFALYRHSLGLAAHSINLGIIEDVGYLSHNETLSDRMQSRGGLSSVGEAQLHEILKLSILQQTAGLSLRGKDNGPGQMITGLPFPMAEDSPLLADVRFHSLLVPRLGSQNGHEDGPKDEESDSIRAFHSMIKASVPTEKLINHAITLVNKQMVRALGLAANVESSKPLSSYGIDSLAAVDLRNWFRVRLGAELTTLDVLNAANLRALCTKVVERSLEAAKT
ncbi:hypothetical protein VPNG_03455 [Cytospora leucostoma]|uniref:Uncharacterized protein n=1 Tax=Cytospora leucostoma TaxID=1230097 RepID=A0A423XFV1_9PEZI|nr:hypothetical protein VPNG_03455 [Cytospora leucostoma]